MRAFAVVTGGGTSGHVLPALAVAEGLVALDHRPDTIHYMGAVRGVETRLVPDTPFPHHFFDVDGLQRSFSRRDIARNLKFAPKLWTARRAAIEVFREIEPRVVVSVGGYASMPAVLAARHLSVPVVVVSYDFLPGRASRVSARTAAACAVAFPESPLPRATVTGAPVRQAVLDVDRVRDRLVARERLGVPADRFMVAVMGGSLGSGVLNAAVAEILDRSAADRGLAVRHVVGERFLDQARPAADGAGGVLYQPLGYEPDMPLVYAAADVLVGRGGASTIHEVAVTGIPAILVPWANSADDHQTMNVSWLADDGAAVLLREDAIDDLPAILDRLRYDPAERTALAERARAKGQVHRSGALAHLVESVAIA